MVTTYPATLAQLDARLLNQLFSTASAPDHWNPQRRQDALNHGARQVYQLLCNKFEDRYFVKEWRNLVPNNNVITLPSDLKRIFHVDKLSGSSWFPVTIVSPTRQFEFGFPVIDTTLPVTTGPNEVWAQIEMTLRNDGPGIATGEYRVRGQYELADLQDPADVCPIPSDYQDMVIYWAAALLQTQAGNADRAQMNMALYLKGEKDLIHSASVQNLTKQYRTRRTRPWPWFRRFGWGGA